MSPAGADRSEGGQDVYQRRIAYDREKPYQGNGLSAGMDTCGTYGAVCAAERVVDVFKTYRQGETNKDLETNSH